MCLPKILLYSRPPEGTLLEESSGKEIRLLSWQGIYSQGSLKWCTQGSLLGPRLYSIQVNDLPDCIEEGELSLFADNTDDVYCIGNNGEEVVDMLNKVMAQVYDWCMKNNLTVHSGKSEAMIMTKMPFIGPLRPLKYGEN